MLKNKKEFLLIILIIILVFTYIKYTPKGTELNFGVDMSNTRATKNLKLPEKTYAYVTSVVDGDTIFISYKGKDRYALRLIGIDAPESKYSKRAQKNGVADCFANESTQKLSDWISKKKIELEFDKNVPKHDKYGRILAYVFLDGVNINDKMIKNGFAYEYTYHTQNYKYKNLFKKSQIYAKTNKMGLWADGVCSEK